ncbi:SAM-dependent methyltransferase [Actinoplanes sp. NPDC026619]|uniref:SAM-dependent methyltransferase n=1 Tax=Actinoplanes sp. NPDC026619 TaxID=3155798 RepID=UPI0033FCEB47
MDGRKAMTDERDTNVPQTARIWNYWLGGTDNFAVDRQVGDRIRAAFPQIVDNARASRAFLVRAVSYVAGVAGIRQFLDVGTGLPTADNTHEVAQRVAPESKIVYVDNDPLVLVHARALLTSSPEGVTQYIDGDGRDSAKVLASAGKTLDFGQPVALIMSGILGHVTDDDQALTMVREYVAALPRGSYLIALDGSHSIEHGEAEKIWNEQANPPYVLRGHTAFGQFFEGLELVDPGVTSAPLWRATSPDQQWLDVVCGVARKP